MQNETVSTSNTRPRELTVSEQEQQHNEDLTGTERLVSNILFSWAGRCVYIVAGFIMPRMIDRCLGQELLGIWDLAWSLVAYLTLVQFGIGASINRYVARCRARGDTAGLNRLVSSAFCIHGVAGLSATGLVLAISLLLPHVLGTRLGENVFDAQWVVFFLGASIGIQIVGSTFGGVLTGCHRWKLHNVNTSGWHAITVVAMVTVLSLGGGLRTLAVLTFAGEVLSNARRVILARRTCRGLRVRLSLASWKTIRELFVFGGKTLIPSMSNLMLNQTTSILIVAYLGPMALALYARPRSLILQLDTLVHKMALVLTPTVSSLQSTENQKAIQELLTKSVRYSSYLVLPAALLLVFFGDWILKLWMGRGYANSLIPAILAVGSFVAIAQRPVFNILVGLNAHGRAGMAQLTASLCSAGLVVLVLGPLGLGLVWAAVGVMLPIAVTNMIYLPHLICSCLGCSTGRYMMNTMLWPLVHVLPFALCLALCRALSHGQHWYAVVCVLVAGSVFLSALYWRIVLPKGLKRLLVSLLSVRCQQLGMG